MEDQIRRKNFDQICRLCLEYASDINALFPLFVNEQNVPGYYGRFLKEFKESIPEIISACIGIEIDPIDKLPMSICSGCEKQLIMSNKFRQKCLLSNDYLLELRLTPENEDDFDTDDDTPLNSLKPPELVLVDSIKDDNAINDMEMDSSCDSVWNTLETQPNDDHSTTTDVQPKTMDKESENPSLTKKTAIKTSKTIPLITPSTPIVPINSETVDCSKSLLNNIKQSHAKKPKMCTVCGMMVKRLRDHMKSHPDALEYSYSHCPRRYLTKKGLIKHIGIQHTEDSTAPKPTTEQKRSMEKMKKYRGETYISKNGVVRGGKCIGPPCNEQCIYKCTVYISNDQRKQIFNHFYNLGSIQKQWEFIARCADRILPKYRRVVESSKRKRNERGLNVAYYFQLGDERIRVCKTFFLNTLDISNSVTKTALEKCNENGELIVGDRRGAKCKLIMLEVCFKS